MKIRKYKDNTTFKATPADVVTGKNLRESNYYKPNQHYPITNISGKDFLDKASKIIETMIKLIATGNDFGIEELNAFRSLEAIVHEKAKETIEHFAEEVAEDYTTKKYEKKPKFGVGDVVKFDAKEYDGNWKHGIIVEANDDGTYAVFVGHTTLGGITEPILYDMLGIEPYKKNN